MASKQTAFVTGANKGLGFEISRALCSRGYKVYVGARDAARGQAAVDKLKAAGGDAAWIALDTGDRASIESAVGRIASEVDALDVLVNNAGTFVESWVTPPSTVTDAQMRETMEVNFFGPFALLHACAPLLTKSRGARVVNISSDMGSLANVNNPQSIVYGVLAPAYQCSKVAINALTVLYAKEWKDTPHKINSASPGWAKTDMGTDAAPLTVAEGADTAIWLATLPADGPSGEFFSATRTRGAMEW